VLSKLNRQRGTIGATLRSELAALFPEGISIETEIQFSMGSIEWSGIIVILDWMSRISGSIALVEMAHRYVPLVINRVLAPYLDPNGFSPGYTGVDIEGARHFSRPLITNAKNALEQLYISPKMLLIAVTLLNVALFIGGTVYTGVQVDSIQKRYEDAAIKIGEAREKYDVADSKLKLIQGIVDQTKITLGDIQRQASASIADLQKQSKESAAEISGIKDKSEQELDRVKKTSEATLANMSSYQKDTEAAVAKTAAGVGVKIEREIQSNKNAIETKQASIDALGLQIVGLSANVDQKALELAKVQKGLEEQLSTAIRLNREFANKITSIARADKITISLAYSITSTWLKILIGALILLSLLTFVLSLFSIRR